jgi:hypothetical protein
MTSDTFLSVLIAVVFGILGHALGLWIQNLLRRR